MKKTFFLILFLLSVSLFAVEKVLIGDFKSRGLLHRSKDKNAKVIIMFPGSGAHGPEEMIPAALTADGKDKALFNQMAEPFVKEGFHVLQLGKPGVDFFTKWGLEQFYDLELLKKQVWNDLIKNGDAAVAFIKKELNKKESDIFLLGHSEGTQVAVDLSKKHNVSGLILLGYHGNNLKDLVKWQTFRREIDHFLIPTVDLNKDGFISKSEDEKSPEFSWDWEDGKEKVSINEVAKFVANMPGKVQFFETFLKAHYCSDGHCTRAPMFEKTVKFAGDLYLLTGGLDLQTRPSEALEIKRLCKIKNKKNCWVEIIPGLQHGFGPPKPPRGHPLLDIAVGPVSDSFLKRLSDLAKEIKQR